MNSKSNYLHSFASDFFGRIAKLGASTDVGNVKFVCTRTDRGAHIVGLVLQIGPTVLPRPTRSHTTNETLAFDYDLKAVDLSSSEFIRRLIDGELVTPLGDYVLARSASFELSGSARIEDAAELGPQQRGLSLSFEMLSDPAEISDRTNWILRAQPEPYDSIQDLLNTFAVAGLPIQARVVMSAIAVIDHTSSVVGEDAVIRVRLANGLDTADFRLGYRILLREGVNSRASLHGGAFKWSQGEGNTYQLGETTLKVPISAVLQCYAVFKEHAFHYWWIGDPKSPHNARRGLLQLYDPELERTTNSLVRQLQKGKSRNFEASVAHLLWMAGFSPIHFGENLTDAPDIVALTPNGNAVVVECTTGGLRSDNKLQKLLDRTMEIREHFKISGVEQIRVQPVVVTSRPQSEVELDVPEFERRGILVFTQDALKQLLVRTIVPYDAEESFSELERAALNAMQEHGTD
jgi:hypothetical protein